MKINVLMFLIFFFVVFLEKWEDYSLVNRLSMISVERYISGHNVEEEQMYPFF